MDGNIPLESAQKTIPLLDIKNICVHFRLPDGKMLHAVDGVSLSVGAGQIHGIVGESGSGKTVLASSILGILESQGLMIKGEILWQGRNLVGLSEKELQSIRGREIAMVFQNAQASLNPALKIGRHFGVLLKIHQGLVGKPAEDETIRLLTSVRLPDPKRVMNSYAHECSGGMAQRVAIAMALSCRPKLLILDEPTSALDVIIAAQIVDLLKDLSQTIGVAMFLISHDLNMVSRICSHVSVMYLGNIVESAPVRQIFDSPQNKYTQSLIIASTPFSFK
jgi:peptide/nickel transport system ATP-binding protein